MKSNYKTKYLILRVPVLYSDDMINLEESAVSLIVKKVMNKIESFKLGVLPSRCVFQFIETNNHS